MAGFDRSKLKPTSAAVIQKQEKEHSRKGFDFLSIEVGDNKVRLFPYHPDGGGQSFAEAKRTAFLEVKVPKRGEDKKVIEGQFELKRKPIFNSRVHGGTKKDLVEAYIDFATKIAIPNFAGGDATVVAKILEKINGNSKLKINGIKPDTNWVVYASKSQGKNDDGGDIWGPVGLLDIKKSVKDLMNEKAAELENPDPFTDPDEGIAVIITRAKESLTPSGWYKVRLDAKKNGMNVSYVSTRLTDDQLEAWSTLPPLHKLFVKSFKRSDLDMQIEGLQRFDEQLTAAGYAIQVFGYDEFLDTIEEVMNEVGDAEDDKQEETKPKTKPKTIAPADDLDKTFAKEPGLVTKKAVKAKPVIQAEPEPEEEEEVQEEEEQEAPTPVAPPVNSAAQERMAQLAAIRAKAGRK